MNTYEHCPGSGQRPAPDTIKWAGNIPTSGDCRICGRQLTLTNSGRVHVHKDLRDRARKQALSYAVELLRRLNTDPAHGGRLEYAARALEQQARELN